MVKSFKESHAKDLAKDLEKLAADRQRQAEKNATEDLVNAPQHTVLSMAGFTCKARSTLLAIFSCHSCIR